jgi:hypothetical protein
MINVTSISELPNLPAVYVLYGGKVGNRYVAYVGLADKLKRRIEQHLVARDSSVATGTSATGLNPDFITELRWWVNQKFNDRNVLEAAELVAFSLFDPSLRSRGNIRKTASELYKRPDFQKEMKEFFSREPDGRFVIPTLQDALRRIEQLEKRITKLESRSRKMDGENANSAININQ